jgi:hypothetical protein
MLAQPHQTFGSILLRYSSPSGTNPLYAITLLQSRSPLRIPILRHSPCYSTGALIAASAGADYSSFASGSGAIDTVSGEASSSASSFQRHRAGTRSVTRVMDVPLPGGLFLRRCSLFVKSWHLPPHYGSVQPLPNPDSSQPDYEDSVTCFLKKSKPHEMVKYSRPHSRKGKPGTPPVSLGKLGSHTAAFCLRRC